MNQKIRMDPKLKKKAPVRRCDWPHCKAACCIYGAWVDKRHAKDILDHADDIIPHLEPDHRSPHSWFDGQEEPDDHALSGMVVHTTIVPNPYHYGGTSCIFLRKDFKCALQVAALENNEHKWRYKPFYCVLHPLDLNEAGKITLDEIELLVREPASCLESTRQQTKLTETFQEELEYLLGNQLRQLKDC
ncbi:MAG: DUF3109 family protein [Anaerolineales bacterium]|jgi:hypothetical protein